MQIIDTSWPDVKTHLAASLVNDPYVCWHLRQAFAGKETLSVCREADAHDILQLRDAPHGLHAWFEGDSDDMRALLRALPSDRDLSLTVGSSTGLRLLQEEFAGTVLGASFFCMVDRERFRPAILHPISQLTQADWEDLQRYPPCLNRDFFFNQFREGKVAMYTARQEEEIVGCMALFPGDTVHWIHVREEFRGQAYGRSLLSHCVAELLQEHDRVFYDVCLDSMASARMCLAVGFALLRQMFHFQGRRRVHQGS